jgi:hypothetical protein
MEWSVAERYRVSKGAISLGPHSSIRLNPELVEGCGPTQDAKSVVILMRLRLLEQPPLRFGEAQIVMAVVARHEHWHERSQLGVFRRGLDDQRRSQQFSVFGPEVVGTCNVASLWGAPPRPEGTRPPARGCRRTQRVPGTPLKNVNT